jgi:hypothetical protein
LKTVKVGFKDGGRSIDPDFQDMVVKLTIVPGPSAIPATSPRGMLALVLLLGVAAMWRFRKAWR